MNKQKLIEKAIQEGFEKVEIYTQKNQMNEINIYQQEVDSFKLSSSGGIAIRGIYQGKLGCCFVEEDSDENIDYCIHQMKANANAITSLDKVTIYAGDENYPEIEKSDVLIKDSTSEQRINFLKQLESKILEDSRIVQVMTCTMNVVQGEVEIYNSEGLNVKRDSEYGVLFCRVLASDGKDQKSGYEIEVIRDLATFNTSDFVNRLIHNACDKLSARSINGGNIPVIIKNNVMCDLLEQVSDCFNGENAYKGVSLLKDKLNTAIFNEKVTLVDEPLLKDGYNSVPFDDEGVASKNKVIVENGLLKTYLHNLKSAMLMDTQTTGNGFKAGYSSAVGIQPTNFYFKPGNQSLDELISTVDKGVLIDTVDGLHAGFNHVTTDFSLICSGFYIENGKIINPVNLITVAGNFMEMMKSVAELADDLHFEISGFGSPSMKFNNLIISGNND